MDQQRHRIEKMLFAASWPFRLGCRPPYSNTENRITIFGNVGAIWMSLGLFQIIPLLKAQESVQDWVWAVMYPLYFCVILGVLFFNASRLFLPSRLLAVLALTVGGVLAFVVFGPSFRGNYTFFIGIVFAVIALVKYHPLIRWGFSLLPTLAIPLMDYLAYYEKVPITGLHSSQLPVQIYLWDGFFMPMCVLIVVGIEKSFADLYEGQLSELNTNLEKKVKERTEELLLAKENEYQATLLKNQFMANTSHELRTPMQGILGHLSLAQSRCETLSSKEPHEIQSKDLEKLEKSIAGIENGANRLHSMIQRLLDLISTGDSGLKIAKSDFDLKAVLAQEAGELEQLMSTKKLKLEVRISPEDLSIHSDRSLFFELVRAVLKNAVSYCDVSSSVFVEAKSSNGELRMTIQNKGLGIDGEDVEKIFDPFHQGKRTDDTTGGTGLGLTLAKKWAEVLGGDLRLLNPSPESTVFEIRIPIGDTGGKGLDQNFSKNH